MQRRTLLKAAAVLPLFSRFAALAPRVAAQAARTVRPGEPGRPSPAEGAALNESVGGRLVQVQSAFTVCEPDAGSAACGDLFQNLMDPFYIDQSVNLTQTLGWIDAFTSEPSAYAVLAASSADVSAAVNFAREHNVRLVVKSGGHSYLGTSNAPDSLLIWTRPNMQAIELSDGFVPQGAAGLVEPEPAVSVGAGAIWIDAYNAVTTVAGRYVQGGGCTTVGVSGLTQGGGEPAGGRGRHRGRDRARRQRLPGSGPVLGAQGRRGRDLRCRHPVHAAHPSAAGLSRPGVRCDHRRVGRRLRGAGRADDFVLPREPVQPALGRADQFRNREREPDHHLHAVPGTHPGPGRADVGPVLRLGHRPACRLHAHRRGSGKPAGVPGGPGTGFLELGVVRAIPP